MSFYWLALILLPFFLFAQLTSFFVSQNKTFKSLAFLLLCVNFFTVLYHAVLSVYLFLHRACIFRQKGHNISSDFFCLVNDNLCYQLPADLKVNTCKYFLSKTDADILQTYAEYCSVYSAC